MRRRLAGLVTGLVVVAVLGLAGPGPRSAAAAPQAPAPPPPEGFRARSMDWTSAASGWLIGAAPCPGAPDPGGTGECATVLRTRDGGARWQLAGRLAAPISGSNEPGVSALAMAGPRLGWAYGPDLFVTADGGRRWRAATPPGGGERVLAMAVGGRRVHAVVSPCPIGTDPWDCVDPPSLWSSTPLLAALGVWRRVPVELPAVVDARLEAHGRAAYVLATQPPPLPDGFYATDDGRTWSARPSPCDKANGEGLVDVSAADEHHAALVCVGDPGFSRAVKTAYRSDDNARTTTTAGTAPELGILADLALSPDGTLVMASASSGSWLYRNEGGTAWTTPLAVGDGGAGWAAPTFTTADTAFVVHEPVFAGFGIGELLVSHDAGRTWSPVDLAGPGAGTDTGTGGGIASPAAG